MSTATATTAKASKSVSDSAYRSGGSTDDSCSGAPSMGAVMSSVTPCAPWRATTAPPCRGVVRAMDAANSTSAVSSMSSACAGADTHERRCTVPPGTRSVSVSTASSRSRTRGASSAEASAIRSSRSANGRNSCEYRPSNVIRRRSAVRTSPASSAARTSARRAGPAPAAITSRSACAGPSGVPDHTVASLSAYRPDGPPNTIAPMRPLPSGTASSHRSAGVGHESWRVRVISRSWSGQVVDRVGARRSCDRRTSVLCLRCQAKHD